MRLAGSDIRAEVKVVFDGLYALPTVEEADEISTHIRDGAA